MKKVLKKRLMKSGKSAVLVIPKWWTDLNGIKVGDFVRLEVEPKTLRVSPSDGDVTSKK